MSVSIEVSTPDACLDDIITSASNAMIYQHRSYISLVAQETGANAEVLYARKNGQLVGALPYLIQDGEYGPVYNSLAYYGSHGGVLMLGDDGQLKKSLAECFFKNAQSANAASATIVTSPLETDFFAYASSTEGLLEDTRIGQITPFPVSGSHEDLLSSFDSVRRRNIRKAKKSGVTVRKSQSDEDLAFLHRVHQQNITAIGGQVKTLAFFHRVKKLMPEDCWSIYIAEIENRPVAALLLMYFNKTTEYYTPAIVEEYRNVQPLAMLIYEAMCEALDQGFQRWNWGGTWLTQNGVYQFKKKWGTADLPYHYYTKVFNSEILGLAPDAALKAYPNFFLFPFGKV